MRETNYTISIIRVIACILIVWNHLSNFMLEGFLNQWNWANVGVQIFFFISGYLYGGRVLTERKEWIIKQTKKIVKPYYLSLLILLPIVFVLDRDSLNIWNIFSACLCIQGLSVQIEGLGQHWFVTYILICYLLYSLLVNRNIINKWINISGGGKFWMKFMLITVLLQVLTIPLALLFSFKISYIITFLIGFCYKERFVIRNDYREKGVWEIIIITLSILGFVLRYIYEDMEAVGLFDKMMDLMTQYIKMVWACAIFAIFDRYVPQKIWKNISSSFKHKLNSLSNITYEIYLVHEFFVHKPYISLFGEIGIPAKVTIALVTIIFVTWILYRLEGYTDVLYHRLRQSYD